MLQGPEHLHGYVQYFVLMIAFLRWGLGLNSAMTQKETQGLAPVFLNDLAWISQNRGNVSTNKNTLTFCITSFYIRHVVTSLRPEC